MLIWCIYNSQITSLIWYYVPVYFCSAIRQFVCYIAIFCSPVTYCAILTAIHHTISENRDVVFWILLIARFVVSWIIIPTQSYHRKISYTKGNICIYWWKYFDIILYFISLMKYFNIFFERCNTVIKKCVNTASLIKGAVSLAAATLVLTLSVTKVIIHINRWIQERFWKKMFHNLIVQCFIWNLVPKR